MKSFRFRLVIAALAGVMGSVNSKAHTSVVPLRAAWLHHHAMRMCLDGHRGFFVRQRNLTDDLKSQLLAILHDERPAMKDSLLFEVSSICFVLWTLTIMAVAVAAFGRDLLPSNARVGRRLTPHLPSSLRSEIPSLPAQEARSWSRSRR